MPPRGANALATESPSSARDQLTRRQAAIFEWIFRFTLEHAHQPSFDEIGEHFGIVSRNGISGHLAALERKGWLEVTARQTRSLRFLRIPDGTAYQGLIAKS